MNGIPIFPRFCLGWNPSYIPPIVAKPLAARTTLYKGHERFLAVVNEQTVINLNGSCSNVLGRKVSFISFPDDLVESFEILSGRQCYMFEYD